MSLIKTLESPCQTRVTGLKTPNPGTTKLSMYFLSALGMDYLEKEELGKYSKTSPVSPTHFDFEQKYGFKVLNSVIFEVVSEFTLQDTRFLILAFEPKMSEKRALTVTLSVDQLLSSIMAEFEVDGRSYLIVQNPPMLDRSALDSLHRLTKRELQIATLVARGQSNKQIGKHLQISEWTVSAHLRRIFSKLEVDSRAAMVYRCASSIDLVNQPLASQ